MLAILSYGKNAFTRTLLSALLLLFCIDGYSQSLTPKEWNKIQKSGDYIIGMGMSESMDQARQVAMGDLVGKISTKVESQFQFILTNKDNAKSEGQMEKIIRSYSSTRLDNVEEYLDKDHGKFVVYRYIKNSDLRAMFKRRINMAKNWAKEAIEREKEGKIGDALQNFYWSLALLRSCPDGDLETISQDYVEQNVMMDIHQRVKSIFENISIKAVASEKEGYSQRLTLNIDYKNKPVTNFYYVYSDGKSSSEIFAAKDGIGELLLPPNAKTKKLKINAEYEGLRRYLAQYLARAVGGAVVRHDELVVVFGEFAQRRHDPVVEGANVFALVVTAGGDADDRLLVHRYSLTSSSDSIRSGPEAVSSSRSPYP